jgi:hypothetical protein
MGAGCPGRRTRDTGRGLHDLTNGSRRHAGERDPDRHVGADHPYTAGPFALANPAGSAPGLRAEGENPVQPCDDFALTVTLPSDYAETHPNDVIRFTMGWTDTGTGQSDYDIYVYKGTVTNTDGSRRRTGAG